MQQIKTNLITLKNFTNINYPFDFVKIQVQVLIMAHSQTQEVFHSSPE